MKPINFAEGLVLNQTSPTLPPGSCVCLQNFDIDITGGISKRKGTVSSPVQFRQFTYVKTIEDVPLLFTVEDSNIVVYTSDMTSVVYNITNIYSNSPILFGFDEDTIDFRSLVIMGNSVNPVQIFVHSSTMTVPANSTSQIFKLSKWNNSQIAVFYDNNKISCNITGSGSSKTISYAAANTIRTFTLLHFSYGVWFNSQYYYGEEIYRALTRGDSKIEQVPTTLLTQLDSNNKPIVKAYLNNSTAYSYTTQPRYYNDFCFSDGQSYTYNDDDSVSYSPYFMSFGQAVFERKFDIKREYFDTTNNLIRYLNHNLTNYTTVIFRNQCPGGTVVNTPYVVTDVTADTFKLVGVTLTNQFLYNRPVIRLSAYNINATGSFDVDYSDFGISPYVLTSSSLLPASLVSGKTYWASVTSNVLQLYFDSSGQYPIKLIPFKSLSISAVNVADNSVTINGHSWANGIPVVFKKTAPPGINVGVTYYTYVVDANTLRFATSTELTGFVGITGAGTGTYIVTENWGVWTLNPEYSTGTLEVVNSKDVLLLRARKLSLGTVDNSVRVRVDDVLYNRSIASGRVSNTYHIVDKDLNVVIGSYNEDHYIYFDATPEIGLSRTSLIQLVNVRTFTNMHPTFQAGLSYNDYYSNNTVITVYGYGSRFGEFSQPVSGAVIQNRVALAYGNSIVLSNVSDSLFFKQYYNNFSVDDRVTGESSEQFAITLSDTSTIRAIIEHQNAMIVFTDTAVYRVTNLSYNSYTVVKIANQGISSNHCVTILHSLLVYYNELGVFALKLEVQETYYAEELSVNISSELVKYKPVLVVFLRKDNRLLVVSNVKIYVLNTRTGKWSEYKLPWIQSIVRILQLGNKLVVADSAVPYLYTFDDVSLDLQVTVYNTGSTTLSLNSQNNLLVNNAVVLNSLYISDSRYFIPYCGKLYSTLGDSLRNMTDIEQNYITGVPVTDYAYVIRVPTFQVDCLAYGKLPSGIWNKVVIGYTLESVVVAAAITSEQLSVVNQVRMVECVFNIQSPVNVANLGVIYGNYNKPLWIKNATSIPNYEGATFEIVKESLQGVGNSYSLVITGDAPTKLSVAAYSFLDSTNNSPTFYSGGH